MGKGDAAGTGVASGVLVAAGVSVAAGVLVAEGSGVASAVGAGGRVRDGLPVSLAWLRGGEEVVAGDGAETAVMAGEGDAVA